MGGVGGVWVVGVGEVSGSWTDGENRGFLDSAKLSLVGEVQVGGC